MAVNCIKTYRLPIEITYSVKRSDIFVGTENVFSMIVEN